MNNGKCSVVRGRHDFSALYCDDSKEAVIAML